MRKFTVLAAMVAMALLVIVPMGMADNISIAVNTTNAVPGTYTTANNSVSYSGTAGVFDVSVSGQGNSALPSGSMNTNTLDASSNGPGTLYIWVSQAGLTSPTGVNDFISTLATNTLSSGWTATVTTYLDTNNGLFATSGAGVTTLGTYKFTGPIGTYMSQQFDQGANLGGAYSLTAEYAITASNNGSANLSANITTPEPASMMLLGAGFLGLGGLFRRRK